MKTKLNWITKVLILAIALTVNTQADEPAPKPDLNPDDDKPTSLTEHADVIYEHTFDKTITIKFILLSVRGKHRLVYFKKNTAKGAKGDAWIWMKFTTPGQKTMEISPQEAGNGVLATMVSPALPSVTQEEAAAINAVGDAVSQIGDTSVLVPGPDTSIAHWPVTFASFTLNKYPFVTDATGTAPEHSPFEMGGTNIVRIKQGAYLPPLRRHEPPTTKANRLYEYVADWILADYAANNTTNDAQKGDEVVGIAFLHADVPAGGGSIHFTSCYFALGKGSDTTITHSFNPVTIEKDLNPNVDLWPLWHYITGPDLTVNTSAGVKSSSQDTATAGTPAAAGAALQPAADVAGSSLGTTDKKSGSMFPYGLPHPGIPNFKSDATGVDASISLTFTPKTPPGGDDSDQKDLSDDDLSLTNPWPTIKAQGGKYLDANFYDVTVSPSWSWKNDFKPTAAITDASQSPLVTESEEQEATDTRIYLDSANVGGQYTRSLQPTSNGTKTIQGEMATGGVAGSDKEGTYSYSVDEAVGYNTVSNNITGKLGVNTGEYSGSTHAQEIWHAYLNTKSGILHNEPGAETDDNFENIVPMQIDLSQWAKPASVTQNSNFYTAAAAIAHFAADVPTPIFKGADGAPEFMRVDVSLTGGGIMGESPDPDRFYGGNTPSGTGAATDLPDPVIRSFGTGKLGLLPASSRAQGNAAGAVSYGNANLTVAFPFPGLSWQFLHPGESNSLYKIFNDPAHPILDDDANRDQINFIAHYDDIFSFRPLFTCDAAWLGAPANFRDRNLISVGGGAEMSVTVINFDLLYEVTVHDTYARQQHLAENVIGQISYDIHF